MTHEIRNMVRAYLKAGESAKAVMATVVGLDGSGYRRPGVRMLWFEDGKAVGAVSGGCVERDIFGQAQSVFTTGIPRMMTYDGRYRLGCEGLLHILLEPFAPDQANLEILESHFEARRAVTFRSFHRKEEGPHKGMGTEFKDGDGWIPLGPMQGQPELNCFTQTLPPATRLLLFGGEHDAVQLAAMAGMLGWDVEVVVTADEKKSLRDFPGAKQLHPVIPEQFEVSDPDSQTAVILMTHSYTKDLKYLLRLCETQARPAYLGVLGPVHRRERLLNELVERKPEIDAEFLDAIHGPAGLDLGAETAQEIGLSVLAEILTVFRESSGQPLRDQSGTIHQR